MPPRRKAEAEAIDSSQQDQRSKRLRRGGAQAPAKQDEKTGAARQAEANTPHTSDPAFVSAVSAEGDSMVASDLKKAHASLLAAFEANAPEVRALLTQLKISLTEAGLLLPTVEAAEPSAADRDGLVIARDVLEVGALWSIRVRDVASFDRYMSLLKTFYDDFRAQLPPSQNREALLGLQLLRMLSSNAIAGFHAALEALPSDLVQKSKYIQHPIHLERWLMEGSYSKVWRAQKDAPREEYKFFVDSLMGTIRHEIASCEEKAYDSLPLRDAAMLLFFESVPEMTAFANERGWIIDPTTQVVRFSKNASEIQRDELPRKSNIALNLQFAKELESIV